MKKEDITPRDQFMSWILECKNCRVKLSYCNICGGQLVPDVLDVSNDSIKNQIMRCKGMLE